MYKQSFSLLYNPEKVSIPIVNCDYILNMSCVDQLCHDAVGFPHCHDTDFEIYYILNGKLDIIIQNTKLTVNEHDYLIIAPGVVHHTLYKPMIENQYFVMVFNLHGNANPRSEPAKRTMSENLSCILRDIEQKKYMTGKDQQDSGHYIEHMLNEIISNKLGWKSMLYHYYTLFIFSILRNVFTNKEKDNDSVNANIAMRIIKFMSDNYDKDISMQDVADSLFCSSRHINRIFRRYFNSTFGKTLSRFRVNYAKNYLVESDYCIEKISELVGFSSPNTLYKLFKEIEGTTPGQYREIYSTIWRTSTYNNKGSH
jgi:AraC-like DNA-binding protein